MGCGNDVEQRNNRIASDECLGTSQFKTGGLLNMCECTHNE